MLDTSNFESEDEFTSHHIQKMSDLAKIFAKHKSERIYLEQYRKVVRSQLANEAAQQGIKAAVQQTNYAESHPKYHQVILALKYATEAETSSYWELESLKIMFEHWRTKRADYRSAMNMK